MAQKTRSDAWAWRAVLACLFLVPLATTDFTWLGSGWVFTLDSFETVKSFALRVGTLAALAAWVWGRAGEGFTVRRSPLDWPLLAFAAWLGVSTVFSIQIPVSVLGKYRAAGGLVDTVAVVLLCYLTIQLVRGGRDVRTLAVALTASATIVAVFGLGQAFGWVGETGLVASFELERVWSTFGNPVPLGGFLVLTAPVALGLALAGERAGVRLAWYAVFAIQALCLLLTYTRGAWLGLAGAVVVLVVLVALRRTHLAAIDWTAAAASVAGAALVASRTLSASSPTLSVAQRLVSAFDLGSGSIASRRLIWEGALDALAKRPVTGWGPGTFRYVHSMFKPAELVRQTGSGMYADNAHSYPLDLAVAAGLPGVVLGAAIVVVALGRSARLVASGESGRSGLILVGIWAAACGFVIYTLSGVASAGSTVVFWVILGALTAPLARTVTVPQVRISAAGRIVVAVVAAALAVLAAFPIAADHHAFAGTDTDEPDRIAAATRAVSLNPANDSYPMMRALAYDQVVWLPELARLEQAEAAGGASEAQIAATLDALAVTEAAYLAAIEAVPAEYDNYVLLAAVYNGAGRVVDQAYYLKAEERAREALEREPLGGSARVQLAEALARSGAGDESLAVAMEALELDGALYSAALIAAEIHIGRDEVAEARSVLEATRDHPRQAPEVREWLDTQLGMLAPGGS